MASSPKQEGRPVAMQIGPVDPLADREVARVRAVYAGYDSADHAAKWDPANPGNACMWEEFKRETWTFLRWAGVRLGDTTFLDVGCGRGAILGWLAESGADRGHLYGIDLLLHRVEESRTSYPGINLFSADAQSLPFSDGFFDVVLCVNVFSSILDDVVANVVAGEVRRVLNRTGFIVWCDIRYRNPWNPNVRGYARRDIHRLFPRGRVTLRPITVAPPLVRRLGKFAPLLYPALSAIPVLCVRYLGVVRPDAFVPSGPR